MDKEIIKRLRRVQKVVDHLMIRMNWLEDRIIDLEEARKSYRSDIVYLKNPRSGNFVKIDRTQGKILGYEEEENA